MTMSEIPVAKSPFRVAKQQMPPLSAVLTSIFIPRHVRLDLEALLRRTVRVAVEGKQVVP
jgi:hypothetical protein